MRPQHFSPAARAVPGFLPKRRPWKSGCQRAAVYDSPTINPDGAARAARDAALEALAPLGTLGAGVWGGDAIYLWARLPPGARALRCLAARPGPAPGACAPAAGPGSGERPLPRLPMRVARAGLARVHTGLSWLGRPPGGCWSRRQRECRFYPSRTLSRRLRRRPRRGGLARARAQGGRHPGVRLRLRGAHPRGVRAARARPVPRGGRAAGRRAAAAGRAGVRRRAGVAGCGGLGFGVPGARVWRGCRPALRPAAAQRHTAARQQAGRGPVRCPAGRHAAWASRAAGSARGALVLRRSQGGAAVRKLSDVTPGPQGHCCTPVRPA